MTKKIMHTKTIIYFLFISIFLIPISADAQMQERELREYTNPDEVISFDRSTTFPDAVEVLNNFAQQFENRLIIDRSGTTGAIGVSLPPMHWKDALNYILRVQNLVVLESEDLYEVVTREVAERQLEPDRPETRPATAPGERQVTTKTREVRINATFFEGSRRALREIGVDWSTLTNNVPLNISDFVSEDGTEQIPSTEFGGQFVSVNARGAQNVSQNVFNSLVNFGDIGGGIEVQALFSAFEADNLGKILATPSVKVMDGEEGRIQVGQDFSIKQRDFAGNVTDTFFSTGTILRVRPQIVEVGDTTLIYLELEAERSSAQPDPVSTVINKQEASTHALLLDGESTVIAGLYRTEQSEVRRGIPILKDLPGWFFGLKYLFGYNSTDVLEDELIILLQAELEEPLDTRIARAFQSKGQLMDDQKQRHRTNLDYVSPKSPVTPENPTEYEFEVPEINMPLDNSDPVTPNTEPEPEAEPEIVEKPEPELKPVSVRDLRPGSPDYKLSESELDRLALNEYKGEWKPMVLENMNSDDDDYRFYVIGGSFTVADNADRLYKTFRDEGLSAHMLYNPATDWYFVAYAGFHDPDEAISYTRKIQRERQPEAWLSRIIREERLDLNYEE